MEDESIRERVEFKPAQPPASLTTFHMERMGTAGAPGTLESADGRAWPAAARAAWSRGPAALVRFQWPFCWALCGGCRTAWG
jgi:hypothetical protein